MGAYQRDGRWMVFYHDENGKRRDKAFGRGDDAQKQAETFDLAVKQARKDGWKVSLGEIATEADNSSNSKIVAFCPKVQAATDKVAVSFEQLCDAYIDELKISGRSPNHIHNLSVIIKNCYYAHMDKDKKAEEFDYLVDIKPFLMALHDPSPTTGKPRSQTTINRYGDYLDAVFNYGIKTGMITKNPVKGRTKPKEKPRAVQLTVVDVEKIMAVAQDHVKWAIEVCFNLGTRSGESELLALKWENVKFDKSEVLIYGRKTKEYRVVPVTNGFLKKLEEMRAKAQTEYIIEYKGNPITNLRKGFRSACKKAGITYPVRLYDMRHMFATTMLANGADLAAVSKLMGHARVTMTADVYYQYLQGEKERAVSLLPVLKTA